MKYPRLCEVLGNEGLSNKEIRIVELIAQGLSNKEIANQLFTSEAEVRLELHKISNFMGFKSRHQLIVWCLPLMEAN